VGVAAIAEIDGELRAGLVAGAAAVLPALEAEAVAALRVAAESLR
jgi:hypothetical protein